MLELNQQDIRLNQTFASKEAAIQTAGELLVEREYVFPEYIQKMVERDALTSTYIGNMVAIPHGTEGSGDLIKQSGVVVIQVPEGVLFDGNEVQLIIGIAGAEGEHLDLLSTIAIVCSEEENVAELVKAETKEQIQDIFSQGEFV
ncbi:PTS sugar transporter subunit IIA [Carnobacterium gallinarum]|uniref:PTS sugar transporter subunit IIA n=1 Tax=Carnobacterium gallinarum TaxID=2749 RepID=UPI000558BCE0|nr:PTS sugar transporter subunit IIA [Carnobacterium gallinarum]